MWSCPWMPPFVPQQTRLHIRTRGSSRAVASCSHDKSARFRQSKLATASKRRVSQALRRPKRSLEDAFLLAHRRVWSWQISLVVPALTGRTPRAARCSSILAVASHRNVSTRWQSIDFVAGANATPRASILPRALNHPRLLPKRDESSWPSLHRCLIGALGRRVVRRQWDAWCDTAGPTLG
jgi:hypothetical protein